MKTAAPGNIEYLTDVLEGILLYHQQLGIDPYPESSSLRDFLAFDFAEKHISEIKDLGAAVSGKKNNFEKKQYSLAFPSQQQIKQAEGELSRGEGYRQKQTTDLPAAGISLPDTFVSGRRLEDGSGPVRLLLVGDFRRTGQADDTSLFGEAEDEMVKKMIKALHLSFSAVYVTNVIIDEVKGSGQVSPDQIQRGAQCLFMQIEKVMPEYICAMGPFAAKTVLKTTRSLSLLRGELHYYTIKEKRIPVVVTYHPHFLLENEEMKKPAWTDLQLLGRNMGLLK